MLGPLVQVGTNHVSFAKREHTKIRILHLFAKIAQQTQCRPSVPKTLQTASACQDFITPIPPATCTASPALSTTHPCEVAIIFQRAFAILVILVRAVAVARLAALVHTRMLSEPPHALIVQ